MNKLIVILMSLLAVGFWFLASNYNTYYSNPEASLKQAVATGPFNVNLGILNHATATVQRPFINKLKVLPIKDKVFYSANLILLITTIFWRSNNNAKSWQKGWH